MHSWQRPNKESMKLAKEHDALTPPPPLEEAGGGRNSRSNPERGIVCGAFLLLFFHFISLLLLLLCFIFFLALKPKNPNEAKRMCRPGQEEIATGRQEGERELFCHWIFVWHKLAALFRFAQLPHCLTASLPLPLHIPLPVSPSLLPSSPLSLGVPVVFNEFMTLMSKSSRASEVATQARKSHLAKR